MTATVPAEAVSAEWYGLSVEQACDRLSVQPTEGLTGAQVAERRAQYGPNALAEEAREPPWLTELGKLVVQQLHIENAS